jgi:hypothetical protein
LLVYFYLFIYLNKKASSDFSLFLTTDGLYGCGSGTNYQACNFLKGT